MKIYEVVTHQDEINICWEINRKLRDGYQLIGGIAVSTNARGEKRFYQAMLKDELNKK